MFDRSIAPECMPLKVPVLTRPETEILPNGIELTSFFHPDQSLISIELIFPAGDLSSENRQTEGYIFKLLAEGTQTKSSKQVADAISFLGASIDFSHQADFDTISISCLSRFLPSVLQILDELWHSPVFPEKEWNTMKETQQRQNDINLQKTSYLAGRLLRKSLYSTKLDYGYSYDQSLVESLSTEQFRNRFQNLKKTGPGLVLLSGFANSEMQKQLRDWLLKFSDCHPIIRNREWTLPMPSAGIQWEERAESQQSSLRIGQYAINSQHEDSALFSLTLELFGGYFGSRLMSNIREDKGWTYGIYAQRVPLVAKPHWVIGTDVKGEVILDAVEEIKKEALILQNELVPDDELQKVKNYMLGQFLSSITNVYGLAERYRSMWANGVDFERVERNQRIIQEASSVEILRMAQQYLGLEDSIISLSGKKMVTK
jgi:zinc protease